jgi:O-antigen/teichoic acid export membrane protein
MPIGVLGYYSVAYTNVSKSKLVSQAVSKAAYPSFSALFGKGDRNGAMNQYRKLHDFICFGNVPVLALIPFAMLPVFSYIFNNEIATQLFLPTTLLCLGTFMQISIQVPNIFSTTMGKPEIIVKANFYSLFIVLPVTVLLIYYFGLTGAGLAFIFRMSFYYAYSIPRYCSECLKIPLKEWYGHVLKIYILIGLTYGMAWFALSTINNYSIISLAMAYIFATAVFLICSYKMIGDEFKGTVFNYLKMFTTKIVTLAYMYENTGISANIGTFPKKRT